MAHEHLEFITWQTRDNARLIDDRIAQGLAEELPKLAIAEHAALLELAVLPTHVHVVAELSRRADVARLVQRMKGATARFANRDSWSNRLLRWERGYDSRTTGRRNLPQIVAYLDRQAERHRLPLLARWSGPSRVEQARRTLLRADLRDPCPTPAC